MYRYLKDPVFKDANMSIGLDWDDYKRLRNSKYMELKEINELKEQWLSAFPDSTHTLDVKRFIRYAVELAKVNGQLDHAEMESRGVSPRRREEYQRQYEFLRLVLDVLDER